MVMALPATVLLSFAALLCLLPSAFVQADYIFEVSTESYSNPTNQQANGNCCDEVNGECEDCEPYYNLVCLRQSGHSHDDISTCSLGSSNPGASDIRTVSIPGADPWPASFQLYIQVFDEDPSGDDMLDRIFADASRAVSNQFSSTQSFTGDNGWVTLGLSFRVQCASGWTGTDCDECIPATGCSLVGGFCVEPDECICNSGWNGSLCDQCIPAAGCSPVGGFCNQPGECLCNPRWAGALCDRCDTGWTGSLCDECIPAAGCSPVGGFCNQSGECLCNPDWDGPLCDQCTLAPECCSGQYECNDGECITGNSSTVECDGISHCNDSSDEDCSTDSTDSTSEESSNGEESSDGNSNAIVQVGIISGVVAALLILVTILIVCIIFVYWLLS